jgi:hypothetical protein
LIGCSDLPEEPAASTLRVVFPEYLHHDIAVRTSVLTMSVQITFPGYVTSDNKICIYIYQRFRGNCCLDLENRSVEECGTRFEVPMVIILPHYNTLIIFAEK